MKNLAFYFLLLASFLLKAGQYDQVNFRAPLDIPLLLAGNFGELRSNHFHAGIDIKTQGKEGLRVYAVEEGYVSRVKIQERGYGKVVYITHPNGFTTVYAHLSRFHGKLGELVKKHQYEKESYTFDWYLDSAAFPVKKSDVIAFSGNSGGSGGPHLHFEIRETVSEIPVNPLLFSFAIKDNVKPRVNGILVYPLGTHSSVEKEGIPSFQKVRKQNGEYYVDSIVDVAGFIGLGISANDYLNGAKNRCGVFDLLVTVNGDSIYEFKTDKIAFDKSRYINAHCDYGYKKRTGKWMHRLYVLENDQLDNYPFVLNNGVLFVEKDSLYKVKVELRDVQGNQTSVNLTLRGNSPSIFTLKSMSKQVVKEMSAGTTNMYLTSRFRIQLSDNALYEDLYFEYEYFANEKLLSGIHVVHDPGTPLHQAARMGFKLEKSVKDSSKLVAVRKYKKWKYYYPMEYDSGWFYCKTRYFGKFHVSTDTKAPTIKPLNVFDGKAVGAQSSFMFKISDDKVGIRSYRMEVNGKWVLAEYDYKKRLLVHRFDKRFGKGKNQLLVKVVDRVGNEKIYRATVVL